MCTRAVSALAKLLELKGIPTTAIGHIRLHMDKIGPPRGVWTPFQLGRPLGEPNDTAFQRRVLLQALGLLERKDGYRILEEFPDDPPNWSDLPDWRPPVTLPAPQPMSNPAAFRSAIEKEIAILAPHWAEAQARFGRSTVGNCRLPPEAWPEFMIGFLDGETPVGGPAAFSDKPALALRFAVDDIKAYYSEAAMSDGKTPASRQVDAWFWYETAAADLIRALRIKGMESELNAMEVVSGRFFVPAPWIEKK
jgi:hypothetical protein